MSLKILMYNIEFLLLFILLLGFLLRVHDLGNRVMWLDETISSLASREILEKGIPVFDSGLFYSRALLFHYLQAGFMIFVRNDFTARLPSVFFGLLTIALAYFIGRVFHPSIGMSASLFTSVFILEVIYSRQARFYQLFQFLFFLTLFFLYQSGAKETPEYLRKRYAWLASFSLIILVNTHVSGLVLLPFFFIIFWREQKDWKLIIIPSLVALFYLSTIVNLSYGNESLATSYAEQYTSQLYLRMRAFLLIAFLGIFPAFKRNIRLSLLLFIPSLILLTSLFIVKVFAIRYLYFLVFPVIILCANAFFTTRKLGKWIFILVVLFAILYPSNLFFQYNYLTQIIPASQDPALPAEPLMDYKSISLETKQLIMEKTVLSLSTPGMEWYLKKPDYVIPFSLNGLETGYALYKERDVYTGAEIYRNQSGNFIFIEDNFGLSKLNPEERALVEKLKGYCSLLETTKSLGIYDCNS